MKKTSAILGGFQTLALAALLASATAFAEETPANNTTVAPAKDAAPAGVLSKVTLAVGGQYLGPSIGRPSQFLVNEYGKDTKTMQQIQAALIGGYKLTDSVSAGVLLNFNYRPVVGQDLTLTDPAVRIANKKMISNGGFNLFSDLRVYPGVTSASRKAGMVAGIRTTEVANYEIPNSKLSVGAFGILRYNANNDSAAEDALVVDAYLGPNLSYQISKTVAATLSYEMDGNLLRNAKNVLDWSNGGTDTLVGVSVDVTPSINVNPYIQLNTGGSVNLDSSMVGAYFSAKLL